jgi:hypothetical protein
MSDSRHVSSNNGFVGALEAKWQLEPFTLLSRHPVAFHTGRSFGSEKDFH